MTAPLAYRNRLGRQNPHLFNWCADDGDPRSCRSGQVGTYTRAATDNVVTSNATVAVGYGQPRWLDAALGASLLMRAATDVWNFTCDFYVQPLWAYVSGYVPAQTGSGTAKLLRIGDGAAKSFDLAATFDATGLLNTIGQYQDGTGDPSVTLTAAGNPAVGAFVEYLLSADAAYKIIVARSVNGGAQQTSALSSAGVAFGTNGFHGSVLKVADAANGAYFAYRQIIIGAGVAPTLATIRGLAR